IAGVKEVEGLFDTHKNPKPNQQVSDFYTSAGSVNGSLTDRHYASGQTVSYLSAAYCSLMAPR
ncbi:hypothetical protein, partial [Aeromonas salmonicida]|uniref:hypothetical protein n=1 Tax=Aeromonas salmonicida TaxID=645 RepID=UPI0023B02CFD